MLSSCLCSKEMGELHRILEMMRIKRGAISFEDREAKILVDAEGHPNDIQLRSRGIGERLIESFMLAANETVAEHYNKLNLPFIYRIHEQPKEEKMQRLLILLQLWAFWYEERKERSHRKIYSM